MKKIYIAGPDVFAPNSIQIGKKYKKICQENNFIGLYPLDNVIEKTSKEIKFDIVKADISSIDNCDYILANLSNFRGTKEHPSCDSGTAWECGYGLSKGKKVFGYTTDIKSIPDIMINLMDLVVNGDFKDTINIIKKIFLKPNHQISETFIEDNIINIDAEYSDIKDISAKSAFILRYRYGKGLQCNAIITDTRNEIDKYGTIDENGYNIDDFNQCANIMIECTCNIRERGIKNE